MLESTWHWHRDRLVRLRMGHRNFTGCGLRRCLGSPLRVFVKIIVGRVCALRRLTFDVFLIIGVMRVFLFDIGKWIE